MKTIFKYLIIAITLFALSTCKKYDEGGWISKTNKHLFGGNKVGDSKTWKLKLYEVNGIDSTFLINTGNIPDFYNKYVTFKFDQVGEPSVRYIASTFLFEYSGKIIPQSNYLNLGLTHNAFTKEDSTQCKTKDNVLYCTRNLLLPEIAYNDYMEWEIKKLTKDELIIKSIYHYPLKNNYKIIFTY